MYISLNKTLTAINRCLPAAGEATQKQLYQMYDLSLRLTSQILAVIYDHESFTSPAQQEYRRLAQQQSSGDNTGGTVTLTIQEALPAMKRLTEALEEHWKEMIHAAIADTARQEPLPYFNKAFVEIEIVTHKGSNNTQVWDTSNRAIQVILNNLKGIFFQDDNMEHMAFSVVGRWGEKGATIIRVSDFEQIKANQRHKVLDEKQAKP